MNSIPFWTLIVAVACAVAGLLLGVFFWLCSACAELQRKRWEEDEL